MDFFGHQEQARLASRRLVALFVCAVLAIIGCIYAAATATLVATGSSGAWQPEVLLAVTVITLLVVSLASAFKTAQLRSGGKKVAELLGGQLVPPETRDTKERMLRNIVEEMSIASGIPVPAVYVLDGETGINAFAAGWDTKDAAVAVTRGCLDQLDREELQGVIAHEFSHVFHGDMRLNIRLMGVLFGIVCIATIGRIVVRSGGYSSKGKGGAAGIALFGLSLILIGYLGVLFARLIQAAVSRQREFLADASAVQYTRNPRGIGKALAKIGGLGAQLQNPHAEEASHMLFADGMKRWLGSGFATHPPVAQRVERLLPGFVRELRKNPSMVDAVDAVAAPGGTANLVGGPPPAAASIRRPAASRGIATNDLIASIGEPAPKHLAAARELLHDLPLDLLAAAREPARAASLVIALLLDRQPARRLAQLGALAERDQHAAHMASQLFDARQQAPSRALLPLLELAIPALRGLPLAQRVELRRDARNLAMADGAMSPFELALLKTLERHVSPGMLQLGRRSSRPTALVAHEQAWLVVLSVLARAGAHDDEALAARAFAQGVQALAILTQATLLPAERCTIVALERAIDDLATVSPLGKRNLVAACAAAASADGKLTVEEADLLRALAESWDCPIPLVTTSDGRPLEPTFTE